MLTLTVEMPADQQEAIFKQEFRLRDAFLRSLLIHNLVWLIAWLCVRQRWVGLLLSLATLLVWLALAMLVAAAYLPIFKMSVVVS